MFYRSLWNGSLYFCDFFFQILRCLCVLLWRAVWFFGRILLPHSYAQLLCISTNKERYFVINIGLCSGICMMAFGLGSLLFNFILLHLINPNNEWQDEKHLFPREVAQNVPMALRYISFVYFGIGTVGCLLMIPKCTTFIRI